LLVVHSLAVVRVGVLRVRRLMGFWRTAVVQ